MWVQSNLRGVETCLKRWLSPLLKDEQSQDRYLQKDAYSDEFMFIMVTWLENNHLIRSGKITETVVFTSPMRLSPERGSTSTNLVFDDESIKNWRSWISAAKHADVKSIVGFLKVSPSDSGTNAHWSMFEITLSSRLIRLYPSLRGSLETVMTVSTSLDWAKL